MLVFKIVESLKKGSHTKYAGLDFPSPFVALDFPSFVPSVFYDSFGMLEGRFRLCF